MFNTLSLLVLVAPLVSGLTVQMCANPTSGGPCTIKWTTAAGDPPTFSLQLSNQVFHNSFAIANNVMPESGSIDLTLPIIPEGTGYTLQAIDIGNINNVFASTGGFVVGPNAESTATESATSGRLTTSGGSTISIPASTRSAAPSSGFGTTRTGSSPTSGGSGPSNTASGAPSSTSNAAVSALKMNFNLGAYAAVLFSAVAGAVIVVL